MVNAEPRFLQTQHWKLNIGQLLKFVQDWVLLLFKSICPTLACTTPQAKARQNMGARLVMQLGFSSKDKMVQRWQVVTLVGTAREQVPVLYGDNRPALARHEYWQNFYLVLFMRVKRYRCFVGTTHENHCFLNTQNTEAKHKSGAVLSPPGRGFEPKTSAT